MVKMDFSASLWNSATEKLQIIDLMLKQFYLVKSQKKYLKIL